VRQILAAVGRALGGDGSPGAVAVAALGLSGAAGNAAVQRALADRPPDVQRDGPRLQMPEYRGPLAPRPPESPYQLHLDPQIEAQMRAMEMTAEILAEERIRAALAQVPLPPLPPGSGLPPGATTPTGGTPFLPGPPAPPAPARRRRARYPS
jgi:hypothetical protein